ncbi:Scr1 family TA system antitoxin-like transcriptional regulator [Micromonospora haikouensis]|uniref:Scr1 family TA system antitoxin-like transcriptional regulator n=1 Tax=Micromonospora haikouensis TaxID=686309 RepID=UPI00378F78ED
MHGHTSRSRCCPTRSARIRVYTERSRVMDFPDAADPELVYIENMAGALYLEKEADIRRYAEMFDQLRSAALNVADSRKFLDRLIDSEGEGRRK